jgi:hypothetical protein
MRRAKPALLSGQTVNLKWLTAGVGVIVALACAVVWFTWPQEKTLTDILLESGYYENIPPTTLSGPGTINTVEFLSNGKVALHPTCDVTPELLVDKVQKSETIGRDLKQVLEKQLSVSGEIREKLEAAADISQISSIHLKLENTKVLLVTDEALLLARDALLRGRCQDAVELNVSNGGLVCQTRAVLEADVIYEIEYNDRVAIGERAQLTAEVAAKLKLDAHEDSTNRVSGRQLFYGVKLASNPILLGASASDQPLKCLKTPMFIWSLKKRYWRGTHY